MVVASASPTNALAVEFARQTHFCFELSQSSHRHPLHIAVLCTLCCIGSWQAKPSKRALCTFFKSSSNTVQQEAWWPWEQVTDEMKTECISRWLGHLSIALYHTILKAHWQAVLYSKVQLETEDLVQPQLAPGVQTLLSHRFTCCIQG